MTSSLRRHLLSGALSLPFLVFTLVIHANPSGVPPATPYGSWVAAAAVGTGLSLVAYIALMLVLMAPRRMAWRIIIITLTLIALSVAPAIIAHRDYYSISFALPFVLTSVWLALRAQTGGRGPGREATRTAFYVATFVLVAGTVWTMLMGYAIATRQEPRWAESILYNLYNVLLLVLVYFQIVGLRDLFLRSLVISDVGTQINGYDVAPLLGPTSVETLRILAKRQGSVSCDELYNHLVESGHVNHEGKRWTCDECKLRDFKVTMCPKYKTLYNRILEIRRVLETFDVGTVVLPENRREIRDEGWRLRLFQDTRLTVRRSPLHSAGESRP